MNRKSREHRRYRSNQGKENKKNFKEIGILEQMFIISVEQNNRLSKERQLQKIRKK